MVTKENYVNNFNISKTFKGASNTLQNFTFMGPTVFEIAGGPSDSLLLVKGVGTKGLVKEGLRKALMSFAKSIIVHNFGDIQIFRGTSYIVRFSRSRASNDMK